MRQRAQVRLPGTATLLVARWAIRLRGTAYSADMRRPDLAAELVAMAAEDRRTFGAWPVVEDPDGVDGRRADLGLEPLHVHITRAMAGIAAEGRTPSAAERARDRERAIAFARSVGWR